MTSHPTPKPVKQGPPIQATRRSLLLGAAGTALTQVAGCGGGSIFVGVNLSTGPDLTDPGGLPGVERSLPIVPLDPGVVDASGVRVFSLVAQQGVTTFRSGIDSNTLGYNGALLGPALRLRTGEKTRIRVSNQLNEPTTVHWHGLFVPAEVDGGPHQAIAPGAQWTADFTVANPASTCWFHPHTHGATGRQVVQGLAGLLIVDDGAVGPSMLPDQWGVDDVALVLQDKRFTATGQIDYALTAADRQTGYLGDVLLVNGAVAPVWQAPRQWLRMRLLNGCNARTLTLRWGGGAGWLQVANEAGYLVAPLARSAITLAPGERAEALVDLGGVALGQDLPLYASSASGGGMGMMGGGSGASSEVRAMTVRVALPRQPRAMLSPPSRLPAAPSVVAGAGSAVRSFSLDGGMMGSAFTINGRSFDINRVDFSARANAVEVWRFANNTMMAHPLHVHGVRMSLLTRDGSAPPAHEQGLRDTFVVEPMQTVVVAVQTAALASPTPLMFHCHILEHEDAGMMAQFITV